jgi:hypothetical protein
MSLFERLFGPKSAFTGSWFLRGDPVTIAAAHTPSLIETLLGTAERGGDEGHAALRYSRPEGDIWFEWGESGQLENVLLTLR